jgi:glycosyltransferase involved in cell wall biosynthesis
MKIEKRVSVIMSTYNEKPEWIKLSVESILNQSHKNIQFVIVLDNPENVELKKLLESYSLNDKRILLVINKSNIGLVQSLNKALKLCDGELIARMDADDIATNDRLEVELKYLENNNLDFVIAPMTYIDEKGNELATTNVQELNSDKVNKLLKVTNISNHPTWLCKKEVYESLNGYRNINYCEDNDFSLRAVEKGFKIGKMSQVVMLYRVRSTGVSKSYALEQHVNSKIITNLFKRNKLSDYEYVLDRIKLESKQHNKKQKEKFSIMNNSFEESIYILKEGNLILGLSKVVQTLFISKHAFSKYKNLLLVKYHSRI